jgi:hypothetical protein
MPCGPSDSLVHLVTSHCAAPSDKSNSDGTKSARLSDKRTLGVSNHTHDISSSPRAKQSCGTYSRTSYIDMDAHRVNIQTLRLCARNKTCVRNLATSLKTCKRRKKKNRETDGEWILRRLDAHPLTNRCKRVSLFSYRSCLRLKLVEGVVYTGLSWSLGGKWLVSKGWLDTDNREVNGCGSEKYKYSSSYHRHCNLRFCFFDPFLHDFPVSESRHIFTFTLVRQNTVSR